jgi:hypothetical protein
MKILTIYISTLFLLISYTSFSQEHEHEKKKHEHEEEEHEGKNRLGFVLEATFIPEASSGEQSIESTGESESKGKVVPTIGLEYTRSLSHNWEIGFSAEVELESYLIVEKELNRENPLILVAFGMYRLMKSWFIFGGGGIELEKHKNLAVLRLGTEYELKLSDGWDITPVLTFDHKVDLNSFALGFSVGKRF